MGRSGIPRVTPGGRPADSGDPVEAEPQDEPEDRLGDEPEDGPADELDAGPGDAEPGAPNDEPGGEYGWRPNDPDGAPAANASRLAPRSRVGRNSSPGAGAPGRPLPCRYAPPPVRVKEPPSREPDQAAA